MKYFSISFLLVVKMCCHTFEETISQTSYFERLKSVKASYENRSTVTTGIINKTNKRTSVFESNAVEHWLKQYSSKTYGEAELATYSQTGDNRITEIGKERIPSLMVEMLKKHPHNDSCSPNGRRNISVRSVVNKG